MRRYNVGKGFVSKALTSPYKFWKFKIDVDDCQQSAKYFILDYNNARSTVCWAKQC